MMYAIFTMSASPSSKDYSKALVALQRLESAREVFLEETTRDISTSPISLDLVSKVDELILQRKEDIKNIEDSPEMREYENGRGRGMVYMFGVAILSLLSGFYIALNVSNLDSKVRHKL